MYERSAIVLERYFEERLGLNKKSNLKINYENFKIIVEEMQRYQIIVEEEEQIIKEFDRVAKEIQTIQKTQEKLYKSNQKLEDDRNQLFNSLDEDPIDLEKKLDKIETNIQKNNEEIKSLKTDFIKFLTEFIVRQKERNKYAKSRRLTEANNISIIEKATKDWEEIDPQLIKSMKESLLENKEIEEEITKIMINNGKEERVGFNIDVIKDAIKTRLNIAKEEAQCYILGYDRMKRLLLEIENDNLKISKYQKVLRDTSVKLKFLEAKKDYIVRFLDNERMNAINGIKVHKKMMEEACTNFEADVVQIDNLYELIVKETSGKATKKAYRELYNKDYLKNIEEKEKNFEEEINQIKIHAGTIINSNYWRIEGIKNIYEIFLKEVGENFDRDLSEYILEEKAEEEIEITDLVEEKETKRKSKKTVRLEQPKEEMDEDGRYEEDIDEEEYDEEDIEKDYDDSEDEYEEENHNEYDDEEYDDEEYDEEEYDEEEYDDDEYDDEEYDDDEYDENEYDDEDENEYEEDEDDEYEIEYEDEEDYEEDDEYEIEFEDEDEYEEDEDGEIEFEDEFDEEEFELPKSLRKENNKKILSKIFKDKNKKRNKN